MAAIADQYDPLIKRYEEETSACDGVDKDCVLFLVVVCVLIWLMIKCVISATETMKIPIKLDPRLSRLLPVNSSVKFEHEGTKYEIVFESMNEQQNVTNL